MALHIEFEVSVGKWPNARKVVISNGLKTQTINICHPSNLREDGYEHKYRIPIEHKFTARDIAQHPDLPTLYAFLEAANATRE